MDNWTTGLTKTTSPGTDRCLVVLASTENGNGPTNVTALTYGGQAMTQIGEYTVGTAGGFNNRIEVWILLDAGLVAAGAGTAIVPTLSAASYVENVQLYSSAVFRNVDQYNPISDIESSSLIGATTPYQIGTAINTLANDMSVAAILCGENTNPQVPNGGTNTYTVNSTFSEAIDVYFSNPGFATSGSSLQISTKASPAVSTEQPTFTFNGTPNRQVAVAFSLRGATGLDNSVRLRQGTNIVGSNYAKPTVSWPVARTYETYGGPTDLWGTTWTPADINDANFGVALSAIMQGNTLEVDHIRITVYTSPPLPIELLSFTGKVSDGEVQLEWQTVTETNNDFFTIERADDELNFEPILTIDGAGNSKEPLLYTASDKDVLFKTTYYRLKQTDFDGHYTYSNVIAVNTSELVNEMVIFPNPANTTVSVVNFFDDELNIRIVSVTGVEMLNTKTFKTLNTIDVSSIPQGLYVVELVRGSTRKTQKIKIDP